MHFGAQFETGRAPTAVSNGANMQGIKVTEINYTAHIAPKKPKEADTLRACIAWRESED